MREKLRSHTGCRTCLRRKKRCDEAYPTCSGCNRLRLTCEWGPRQHASQDSIERHHANNHEHEELEEPNPVHASILRLADHDSSEASRTDVGADLGLLADAFLFEREYLVSEADFEDAFNEHVIVIGCFYGWCTARRQYALDPRWDNIIQLEQQLKAYGHGPVARMAGLWCFRNMMKYLTTEGKDHTGLQSWLIPRKCQLDHEHPAFVDFVPWPAIRERMISNQYTYCTNAWLQRCVAEGYRFIWPYKPNAAFSWDSAQHVMVATPEFRLRVNSLRSFTLSRDYLNRHPELRGEAPQLEPSMTLHQPSNDVSVEKMYWDTLRLKARQCYRSTSRSRELTLSRTTSAEDEHQQLVYRTDKPIL